MNLMPVYEVNNVKLFYKINGSGEPIIFTHGHSMYHKQWEPQVKELSNDYQTIVWDVRGHGYSSLPSGKVDPEDFSRDLISLLDYLEIQSTVLCGLSMGGHISIQTAIRYPERVKGLILIGTPFTNSFNWFEKYTTPISKFSLRFLPFKMTAKWTADVISKINPENHAFVMESFSKMTKNNFLRHWSGNLRMESKNDLNKIQCPTMILHGEKDNMVGRQQQYLTANIKDAEFYTITNAHHLTNRDNPEDVTDHIQNFMKPLK